MSKWWRRITRTLSVDSWRRRIGLALTVVFIIVLTYALIYRWAMATFEGESVPIYKAVQVVIESLTTAGFGGHAPWTSIQLNFLVLAMNVTGVLLMFLALPVFAIPMLRQALETRPPQTSTLSNHVIICAYTPRDEVLRKELEAAEIPSLIIDQDPDLVNELLENNITAIHGDPQKIETLHEANTATARALIADVDDETNPIVILSALRVNPDLRVISVVQDQKVALYHRYAGADETVQSRQQLGRSLAMRAMMSFSEKLRNTIAVETDLEITELLVEQGSDLIGQTLEDAAVFDQTGITVIGMWTGGKFIPSPDPGTTFKENTILLVAGRHETFEAVHARPIPMHSDHPSRVIVCGYGTVGQAVVETLQEEGIDVEVVEIENRDGVDVVGDATDPETLSAAGIANARTVVLTLDDDTSMINTTLLIKQVVPDIEIVARANNPENVWKLYNAGADFVLSLPTVTGEILASLLLGDEEILTSQTEFVRTDAPAIVSQSLGEADLRDKTGCTVVAVERGDKLVTEIGAEFVVEEDDVLVAVGSKEATERFIQFVH
jgi:Trk K+ transport system NAD-binding subunit